MKSTIIYAVVCVSSLAWALSTHAQHQAQSSSPSAPTENNVLRAFTTDGCSRFLDRDLFNKKKDWCHCCVVHDLAYWKGGTSQERKAADIALKQCVEEATGDKYLALTMYRGVRLGGKPHWKTSYRWGYGWKDNRAYTPLSLAQQQQAEALQAEYLQHNPTLSCAVQTP